ncbi:family 78 glycoside hydrolase catalytic domain [Microbacterium sp. C5A9]|uniref:alpha-L-rhamnosidase n=1 Tax=Microbacterium sp. C5A9 TaxID=2736663 RepID=UPI001F52A02D|nr:alpha-L-rhamnosidase [Microbacterium sp. C5A9]MCI1017137.1 family 78 glycoside hydrolase catalytic domain [Microbacterium sp. C5A9]
MAAAPDPSLTDASTRVVSLRSQHGADLLGVPGAGVRLTWRWESDDEEAEQRGYQIAAGGDGAAPTPGDVVHSGDSVAIPAGDLASGERRTFSVRIATARGWTDWSAPLVVEAGLESADLRARVIGIPSEVEGPAALLRTEFAVDTLPERARLRLSALGLVDAWINGRRAGDARLTPGWTSYQERVLLDTIDVTGLLHEGTNVIVLEVGDGWYRGRMGFAQRTEIYGDRSGALAQIDTEHGVLVSTDTSWRGGFGAVRSASIYDGTAIDLNHAPAGLHTPGFDDAQWTAAEVIDSDLGRFEPRSAPPVRIVAELDMARTAHGSGAQFDAGQNITGWVRLVVRGTAGDRVTIRHAEILEPSGELHTAALRTAAATDHYILDRDGEHVLEPQFTFHGFQYAQISGDVEVLSATAVAISSDLPQRSSFRSASAALDRFHSNVLWSQRDNFVSVPTDCPQRDERLGWTGDAQAFAATASTLMDAEAFWRSWLRDLEIDQTDEGGVASVVPDIIRFEDMRMGSACVDNMGRAGWADAATIVPWAVYEAGGSDEVLRQQLRSMRRWVEHLRGRAGDDVVLPTEPFQYGDWLDPDAPGAQPWQAKVSSDYVANAFYVHSARLLARAEALVGDDARAGEYADLADRVAAETWRRWGAEAATTQTGAALALEFRIAPDAERESIAAGLAANVRAENGRISTGFLGTPLVLFALSNTGHLDEAYLMLLRREAPSWLYQVDRGATTVWERWDAILPDGRIHSGAMDAGSKEEGGSMLSFNHYAYGAVIDWVYRTVAGIAPAQPGYRVSRIAPRPAVGMDEAAASVDTPYGRLAIDWRLDGDVLRIAVEVPFGTTADLDLPVTADSTVTVDDGSAAVRVGPGAHEITVTAPAVARR